MAVSAGALKCSGQVLAHYLNMTKADRAEFTAHVSHIRKRNYHTTHSQAYQKSQCLYTRHHLRAVHFPDRIYQRQLPEKRDACPWDYSDAALNYKGIIRLDYAPVWFIVGLIYEKMLCATNKRPAFPEALRLLKTP